MARTKNPEVSKRSRSSPHAKLTRKKAEAMFNTRGVVQEKEFPATEEFDFYKLALESRFKELLKKRTKANLTLVREFYITSALEESLGIAFREKEFFIDAWAIKSFYKLPTLSECRFHHLRYHLDEVPWDTVLAVLGGEGAAWTIRGQKRYLERKVMNDEARVWLNFMTYNVMPQAHILDINEERAILLYLLMTQQPVDLTHIISNSI